MGRGFTSASTLFFLQFRTGPDWTGLDRTGQSLFAVEKRGLRVHAGTRKIMDGRSKMSRAQVLAGSHLRSKNPFFEHSYYCTVVVVFPGRNGYFSVHLA